jgi:DMSO/TMAO reductase YedYZ molybdopterin-dependent catalytic subunit
MEEAMPSRDAEGDAGFFTRRGFIQVVAASAGALLLQNCSQEEQALGYRPKAKSYTAFITPSEEFYLVAVDPSYRPPFGQADVDAHWSLELVGLNGQKKNFSYPELHKRANRIALYTFECIGNQVGGQLIGNARWHVVPLKTILQEAPGGVSGAHSVMFEGLDDFYSSVSLARCLDDYAFIAMQMNDVPLPGAHGFPARVILPDLYGMKQPRWLRRITLQESADTTSYWEKRGWAGEVPVKTTSRIDRPQLVRPGEPFELTGIAFAGKRGIAGVEVSLDDGAHWTACELVTGERPDVWSLWRYRWDRPTPGRHRLKVRATDGTGELQTAKEQGRYPDGASGYHQVSVDIQKR